MWALLITVVICTTLAWVAWRVEKYFYVQFEHAWRASLEPEVVIPVEEESKPAEPIPADLMNLALQESEDWAKQGVIRAMVEMYERCGDWNVVRRAYGSLGSVE